MGIPEYLLDWPHRGKAEQVCLDCESVGIGDVGVGRIRHRWVETRAVAPKPALDGIEKILIGIVANTGSFIGRDIGRIERAEGQRNGQASGILLAPRAGMTDHAICGARQIFAAFNHVGAVKIGGSAGRIGGVIVGKRH
jgi:hypothetical protein